MNKKEAFDFLKRMADGVAVMFGSRCETLIHDMNIQNHPIIYISNGHVTSRKIGSTEDVYGYTTTNEHVFLDKDFINTFVLSKDGKRIKSSTFHLKGEDYHYAFGINFDFSLMYEYQRLNSEFIDITTELNEAISGNEDNGLIGIFDCCLEAIGKPANKLNRLERLKLIAMLMEENAFSFQRSVPYIGERLGISRNTVYNYINELE